MQRLLFYHPIGNRPAFVKVTGHASSVMVNAYDKTAQEYNATKKESPGLDFSGSGRGHNTSVGTFEILEIEYDEDGKIVAFAANFVQQGSSTTLFSAIIWMRKVQFIYPSRENVFT
ncbi:hypothetical protein [Simkania negevensis]|nr:hypothetical protein [Simkania negevensis]